LGGLDLAQPSGLGWKGSRPTHVSGILLGRRRKVFYMQMVMEAFWRRKMRGRLCQILIASMLFHPAKMLECCCPPSPLDQ